LNSSYQIRYYDQQLPGKLHTTNGLASFQQMNKNFNAVAGHGIQLEVSRSLHINQWAGFIDLSASGLPVSLSSYWGFGPQAVSSVVRAKLRTFNHESLNFKNTEIWDWDVIVAYQPNSI
jgi:hypothetical protein